MLQIQHPPEIAGASGTFEFLLNGKVRKVTGVSPQTTVLNYFRSIRLTGSKEGCAEGDCGACAAVMVDRDAEGKAVYRSFNTCIALVGMLANREIYTVEGVGGEKIHPVQKCMAEGYGSQCGYCTPGFVMSMFEGYYRPDIDQPGKVADQLCGNLCRCTGYRPIRDAMDLALKDKANQGKEDPFTRRLAEKPYPLEWLGYSAEGQKFYRPTDLGGMLDLLEQFPDARLIAGGTEIGVEITKKFQTFSCLVSTEAVPEIRSIRATEENWFLGAAATLTEIEAALKGEYPSLDKMWAVFASRQIRNRATLGGNLVTASPIGDSAPVLLSLDASVVLVSKTGERTLPLAEFFLDYRKTALKPGEIMAAVVLPRGKSRPSKQLRIDSFKVSKRREMDISTVAAAFAVELDESGRVSAARLAYGGVAPTPARALAAEKALIGKKWSPEIIEEIRPVLQGEFKPISDVRGSAAYRGRLIVDVFRKFVLEEKSEGSDLAPVYVPGRNEPEEDASRGQKHESALGHATGRALYVEDESLRRPMLEVWPVLSPHAHAKILRRDASEARTMPGVVAVLLAEDVPGLNNVGPLVPDEILLADEEVFFHGHPVALVVGESKAACRAAAARVAVEYEPLPAILTVEEAIRRESFLTQPHRIVRGDFETNFADAEHRLEGEFSFGGQEHFYLETQAAWAERGDEDDIVVVSSTQHPTEIQATISHLLHLPRNKVIVKSPRMGGGFGGKETQGSTCAAMVSLASWLTGRPARWQLDRDLDMQTTGKRHPFYSKFSVGFSKEGKLLAVRVELVSNGGWSLDLSSSILDRALFHFDNSYYLPHVEMKGRVAKTNLVSFTAFRGFGGPQGMLVIEEIMDRVARHLGLPPDLVRERNLYHGQGETNTTPYGQDIMDNRIQAIWHGLKEQAHFEARRSEIDAWNREHAWVKRGLAITPVKFGISFTASHLNQAGALIVAYLDGSLQVNHGGTEMGQGLYTKILGVVMRELGLEAAQIRMMKTSTEKVPNTSPTAASSGSDLNGAAVRAACATLRERLLPVAAGMLQAKLGQAVPPDTLVFSGGKVFSRLHPELEILFPDLARQAWMQRVSLSATGYYFTPDLHYDMSKGRGRPFHYFACGAAVCEVEVDGLTGTRKTRRVDILHDVGASLNPNVDKGQIEGGFVQGMGWLTSEQLKWDEQGRLLTRGASTYEIPAFSDAPAEFNVVLLPKAAQPSTIHGSKAVGEPPLMLAIAAREAIRDAVAAFGSGGEISLASPATCEAIHEAVRARLAAAEG